MSNLNRSLRILIWSYVFIYIVICSLRITQVDIWWQLAEGAKILQTWHLPTTPAAAYGLPASPYFDEYAGYEVILALIHKLAGFPGIWLVFAAVYLSIIFLPVATTEHKYPSFDLFSTTALLFAGLLMRIRLEQRPELVGALLLVLLMAILRKAQLENISRRTLLQVFVVFFIWTNTHSTFVFGFFVLGLWGGCELLLKYRKHPLPHLIRSAVWIGGVALFATMLNPYGPQRLLFPFIQASDPGSTALSPEMWPASDLSTSGHVMVAVTIALLAWGILTTRGVPLWLIIFSVFAVVVSFKSLRFINLLAISVLFVYAFRSEPLDDKGKAFSKPLSMLGSVGLSLLCIFFLFGDAFGAVFTYGDLRGLNPMAVRAGFYAPEICAIRVDNSVNRVPVLCGHGTGSYLSFEGTSQFRPLLDSGLSHFSNDTKRYFFFLWYEPEALGLALQDLKINYVILNMENFGWAPTLHRLPDWKFVTCTPGGMLWERSPGGPHPLSAADRDQIDKCITTLLKNGEVALAFDYSTLLDDPNRSLTILEQFNGWRSTETFIDSLIDWVDSLPPATVQAFLTTKHSVSYPLIDALLSARAGPDAFSKFLSSNPPGPRPWYWQAIEVQSALQQGDKKQATALFNSVSPAPASSVLYYKLWREVNSGNSQSKKGLSAYGQWQTWDDDAKEFMKAMSIKLNDRIRKLD